MCCTTKSRNIRIIPSPFSHALHHCPSVHIVRLLERHQETWKQIFDAAKNRLDALDLLSAGGIICLLQSCIYYMIYMKIVGTNQQCSSSWLAESAAVFLIGNYAEINPRKCREYDLIQPTLKEKWRKYSLVGGRQSWWDYQVLCNSLAGVIWCSSSKGESVARKLAKAQHYHLMKHFSVPLITYNPICQQLYLAHDMTNQSNIIIHDQITLVFFKDEESRLLLRAIETVMHDLLPCPNLTSCPSY